MHTSEMRVVVPALILAALLAVASPLATAQAYPNRAIHIIAPFPAGGGYDFLSRLVGSEMTKTFGQPVIVENKAGANGNIGTDAAAKSAPDGYTLLMGGNSPLSLNVGLYPKLPYDPVRDFEPIARVATQPNLFAANPKVPVKSVAELVQYAKANPGKLTYASNGNGSPQHLAAEQLKRMAGIDMVHVPYKGAGPGMAALLAAEVDAMFAAIPAALPHLKSDRLRALAVGGGQRSPLLSGIPTITESGFQFDATSWYGVLAPLNTPPAIVAQLHATLARTLNAQAMRAQLTEIAFEINASTPEAFARHLRAEIATWSKVIAASGLGSSK